MICVGWPWLSVPATDLVSFERTQLKREETDDHVEGITLEAWLPTNWTGRFLSTGNGGVSGCIQCELTCEFVFGNNADEDIDEDMAYTAGLGFATVGEN